jgi:hypothetical protein
MPGRKSKQCRERWTNVVDPKLNYAPWSEEEEQILVLAQQELGNKWSQIEKRLPGRSANSIKNYWYSALRRGERKRAKVERKLRKLEQTDSLNGDGIGKKKRNYTSKRKSSMSSQGLTEDEEEAHHQNTYTGNLDEFGQDASFEGNNHHDIENDTSDSELGGRKAKGPASASLPATAEREITEGETAVVPEGEKMVEEGKVNTDGVKNEANLAPITPIASKKAGGRKRKADQAALAATENEVHKCHFIAIYLMNF